MEQTVQEQNKIEQLMRPRYRVIATYPFNDHFMLNEVIELNEYDGREHLSATMKEWYTIQRPLNPNSDRLPLTMHESTFNLYPHLFKRLRWFEEREIADLPQYLNGFKSIKKVVSYEYHGGTIDDNKTEYQSVLFENETVWCPIWLFEPATEQEYLTLSRPGSR